MLNALLADEVFTGNELRPGMVVLLDGDVVRGLVPQTEIPSECVRREYPGSFISPGLIDLQLYGGNGKLFSHSLDVAALEATYAACLAGGCTHFMITLATNTIENFVSGLAAAKAYLGQGKKGLLGVHLEGPYLNPVKRGAHIEHLIKKPTAEEVSLLLEKGRGVFRMMTLAPEQCDPAIVRQLMEAGILVSAGHSDATYAEATAGFALGIPVCTHFFNAMSPLQGRAPGFVGAVYDHPTIKTSIIGDGIHVDFDSVRLTRKILGNRLFFITDAVVEIGEGYYPHVFKGDRYTMPDGTLSGSCMTMLSTLKNAVTRIGIPLGESLRMCCTYPAALVPEHHLGDILPGRPADLIIVDKESFALKESVVG